jgi:arginine decarboxylase
MYTTRERVLPDQAIGRVSAETIGCYPPGQAIFVAGECITREGVDYLKRAVAAGGHLKRVQDDDFQTIEILGDDTPY